MRILLVPGALPLLHCSSCLKHWHKLALLLESQEAWSVVASSNTFTGDEDVRDGRSPGPLRELRAQGFPLVAHVVQLQRRVFYPHVDQDLLGLLAEGSRGEAEHNHL